jgi:DNA repair protein RadC
VSFLAPDQAQMLATLGESLRALSLLSPPRSQVPPLRCEVGRVAEPEHALVVRGPDDLAEWLAPEMEDLAQEQLRVALLNTKHRVLRVVLVYQGSIDSVSIRPADVYRDAVASGAAAVVLLHNHPSGDPTPSAEDATTTRILGEVGTLLGVDLLDHLVIGRGAWTSLAREGLYYQPGRNPGVEAARDKAA